MVHALRLPLAATAISAALIFALASPGCAPEPGIVPTSSTSRSARPSPTTPRVTSLVLIVPEKGYLAASMWTQGFRLQAAHSDVFADVVIAEPGKQSDAVRNLSTQNYGAMVILPDLTDTELPAALTEARNRDVPILLLDHPVAVTGEPLPIVTLKPLAETAKQLVEAAVADAKEVGFPASGPAAILVNGPYDDDGRARVAALRQALTDANVEILPDVVFRGFVAEAKVVIEQLLADHPDVAIMLAEDDQGARAAGHARLAVPEDHKRFALSVYGIDKDADRMAVDNYFSGLVKLDLAEQATVAFRTAVTLAQGQPVPPNTVVDTPFKRATGQPDPRAVQLPMSARPTEPGIPLTPRAPDAKAAPE